MLLLSVLWVMELTLGCVRVIAPWNYPFHNIFGHLISTLFAGNGVVFKVSEYSTW